jgi:single-strand DNA-binding protein
MTVETVDHRNEVTLVGRVSADPEVRVLPSGDEITVWRLVVARGVEAAGQDTLDCSAWSARTRKTAASWSAGDVVEVQGALRRRFWRTPASLASRCEVEVSRARRVKATRRQTP